VKWVSGNIGVGEIVMINCFDDAINDNLTDSLGSGQKVFTGSILDVTGRHWGSTWIAGPTEGGN